MALISSEELNRVCHLWNRIILGRRGWLALSTRRWRTALLLGPGSCGHAAERRLRLCCAEESGRGGAGCVGAAGEPVPVNKHSGCQKARLLSTEVGGG